MKRFYESKAVWLGLLTLIVSILSFLQNEEWVVNYPYVVSAIGTTVGILTIIIRYLTDVPMKLTNRVIKNG